MKKIIILFLALLGVAAAPMAKATVGVTIPIFDAAGESLQATPAEVTAWLGISGGSDPGTMGRVTQQNSKNSPVTLDSVWGEIAMNGTTMSPNQANTFTLTNPKIAANDLIISNMSGGNGGNTYTLNVDNVSAGSCRFTLRNASASPMSDAVVIRFTMLKGPAG